MKNNTIFDDNEIMEVFDDAHSLNHAQVKLGMVYFYEHESKCANCLQTIIMPYPITGIWKHKDSGYDDTSCEDPSPAPTFFLLEIENNPKMNPSGYRQRKAKCICKIHSKYWNVLINEFLGLKPKSKTGWYSRAYNTHYMTDSYRTACGISVSYKRRKEKIFVTDKEPPEPIRTRYRNETCEKCWNYYIKNVKGKKK